MTKERLEELAGVPDEINWRPTRLLHEAHEMATRIIALEAAVEEMRLRAVHGCETKQKDVRDRQFTAIIDIAAKVRG